MATRFAFDATMCAACHSCEAACAVWHGLAHGEQGYRVIEEAWSGEFPHARQSIKTRVRPGCDLCASAGGRPRCALACPTGALRLTVRSPHGFSSRRGDLP